MQSDAGRALRYWRDRRSCSLLVSVPSTISVADFMHDVKGVSSNALNERFGTLKWAFKWQIGYGLNTVCSTHVSIVGKYIENQKQHHADGTLWPNSEPSE